MVERAHRQYPTLHLLVDRVYIFSFFRVFSFCQARQAAEKEARKRVPPEEMFLSETELYSEFDAAGVPTKDKSGEPLSKSAIKKLKKEWEKQKKLYEKAKADAAK